MGDTGRPMLAPGPAMNAVPADALRDRTILLTGAAGGIGSAAAGLFAAAGARLALLDRETGALAQLQRRLPRPDAHRAWALDLCDERARAAAVQEVLGHFGKVDVLINNAGLLVGGRFEEAAAQRLRELIEVNLTVPLFLCQLLVPHMRQRGQGHIINVFSSAGLLAVPGFAAYGASKAGLFSFSRSLRRELRATGIRVSALCPGSTASPMTQGMSEAGAGRGVEPPHAPGLPARALLETVLHPRDVVFVSARPRAQRLAIFLDRVFPRLLDAMWAKRCDAAYYAVAARGGRGTGAGSSAEEGRA